jgi:uncharacterized membrane protein YgdD (TMEM256/DUF423 family)
VEFLEQRRVLIALNPPVPRVDLTGRSPFLVINGCLFVFMGIVSKIIPFMNSAPPWISISAGILGLLGVALGAFGAHALKETLIARSSLEVWHTAVLYNLVHSAALLAVGRSNPGLSSFTRWIARLWITGVILFSGSLYWLSLGGPKFLGPVTPLGGLAFLAGWLLVTWDAIKSTKAC